ncbi:MAG: S1 RNA-binding domain-containing protein [Pseudomonadota bacterium]
MNFWQYLNVQDHVVLQTLNEGLVTEFSDLMSRGHSVADLVGHFADEFGHLPVDQLRKMAQANRTWKIWIRRKEQHQEALQQAGLPPLPESIFGQASTPDQLDAAVRVARLCPLSNVESEEQWASILESGVKIWSNCIALTRKTGKFSCRAKDLSDPNTSHYDAYIQTSESIEDLAPHRWLAMRRGEREGILELILEFSIDVLLEQLELHRNQLGPTAKERQAQSLLQELVLDDLVPWVKQILDTEVEAKAIVAAGQSLAGLLQAEPIQIKRLGAIYFGRPNSSAAAIVADREGELLTRKTLRIDGDWQKNLLQFVEQQALRHVVLPTSAPSSDMLSELESKLVSKEITVIKVRAAALAEARIPLTDPPLRLGTAVASALVLARRALDPLKEWAKIDPVNIGIAEYQSDLNPDRLRAALTEEVELCRLERRKKKSAHLGIPVARGNSAMSQLNPLVKSIADLKTGMSINGMVTNISHFGAFVNIGLQHEGLVHISELSNEFVSNPNEVVSVGQQVKAYVLSVDTARARISLSLKKPRIETQQKKRENLRKKNASPQSKAEVLATLERLFKK